MVYLAMFETIPEMLIGIHTTHLAYKLILADPCFRK